MANTLTLREYRESDAERVLAVHEAAFRASGIDFVPEAAVDEELRDVTGSYSDVGGTFLVGTVDCDVVATGGYRPREEPDVAELGHLRVHPEHQRRGYAGRLMDEVESRALDDGFRTVVLKTHEDLVASQALYEKCGYEVYRREPHPVTGDEMIHYHKPL